MFNVVVQVQFDFFVQRGKMVVGPFVFCRLRLRFDSAEKDNNNHCVARRPESEYARTGYNVERTHDDAAHVTEFLDASMRRMNRMKNEEKEPAKEERGRQRIETPSFPTSR